MDLLNVSRSLFDAFDPAPPQAQAGRGPSIFDLDGGSFLPLGGRSAEPPPAQPGRGPTLFLLDDGVFAPLGGPAQPAPSGGPGPSILGIGESVFEPLGSRRVPSGPGPSIFNVGESIFDPLGSRRVAPRRLGPPIFEVGESIFGPLGSNGPSSTPHNAWAEAGTGGVRHGAAAVTRLAVVFSPSGGTPRGGVSVVVLRTANRGPSIFEVGETVFGPLGGIPNRTFSFAAAGGMRHGAARRVVAVVAAYPEGGLSRGGACYVINPVVGGSTVVVVSASRII